MKVGLMFQTLHPWDLNEMVLAAADSLGSPSISASGSTGWVEPSLDSSNRSGGAGAASVGRSSSCSKRSVTLKRPHAIAHA